MKNKVAVGLMVLGLVGLTGCSSEGFERLKKDMNSAYNGGLNRHMIIYSETGDILAEYEGKFDIEYTDGRIRFMESGKMRNIYLGNSATVIVEEK